MLDGFFLVISSMEQLDWSLLVVESELLLFHFWLTQCFQNGGLRFYNLCVYFNPSIPSFGNTFISFCRLVVMMIIVCTLCTLYLRNPISKYMFWYSWDYFLKIFFDGIIIHQHGYQMNGGPYLFQLYRCFGSSLMIPSRFQNNVGGSENVWYWKSMLQIGNLGLWMRVSSTY